MVRMSIRTSRMLVGTHRILYVPLEILVTFKAQKRILNRISVCHNLQGNRCTKKSRIIIFVFEKTFTFAVFWFWPKSYLMFTVCQKLYKLMLFIRKVVHRYFWLLDTLKGNRTSVENISINSFLFLQCGDSYPHL